MQESNIIREARLILALTQKEVAEKVAHVSGSCTPQNYAYWEGGKHIPRLRQQRALAQVLGLELSAVRAHFTHPSNPFNVDRAEAVA